MSFHPSSTSGHQPLEIVVIGAGLAGSEAAWQAAQRGLHVTLYEMRPHRMTSAHSTDRMAELVCSNSLGSNLADRALGLLKNELRRMDSLIIRCADATAVPAGGALAVGREAFSAAVTDAVTGHPNITVRREELTEIPSDVATVVATGPLTSPGLAEAIRRLAGQAYLSFFDAMAPIVTLDSIDFGIAFRQSRYTPIAAASEQETTGDYINCPLTREQYEAFVAAVHAAEKNSLSEAEADETARRYFEACLPIEVLAARDVKALSFGPMTPLGLRDPRTGRRPYAVVQLRQDNVAGTLYNLVGFQTNIKWGDQERVLRMIPGLENAEFVRFGQMHRNTFINSPALLRPTLQWHDRDDLFFAGQITGMEGYVGSTAGGLWAGLNIARVVSGQRPLTLPPVTMLGALLTYITAAEGANFQPMKANFGLLPPIEPLIRDKRQRYAAYAVRALAALEAVLLEEAALQP